MSLDIIKDFLKQAGKTPLLTAEQEIELGRIIQAWRQHPDPVPAHIKQKGLKARDEFARANLRLVVSIAKKYLKRGIEYEDLIDAGCVGLMRGIDKFDPSRGFKASTYLTWWIRQAITRTIANDSRTIRLPVHVWETQTKIKRTQGKLSQSLGREPSIEEIAEAIDKKPQWLRMLLKQSRPTQSLDYVISNKVSDGETELLETIADNRYLPDLQLQATLLKHELSALLDSLRPQQKAVIELRYGLTSGVEMTLKEVGSYLNLSRERIRQIELISLGRLKRLATKRGLLHDLKEMV